MSLSMEKTDESNQQETKRRLREILVNKPQEVEPQPDEYEEPLSPVACLTSHRSVESCILGIVGFRKQIDVKSLKISLQNNLAQHQRFSSVVVRDKLKKQLKWCLTNVVVDDHVIVPSLPPSFTQNPNFVNEYTASLVTAPPLNPCRPLWEVHVLNAASAEAAATLVLRIHHSLGDCVSMLSLLRLNTTPSTAPQSFPTSMATIPQHQTPPTAGLLQTVYEWVIAFWLTFIILLDYAATLLWKRDRNPLSTRSQGQFENNMALPPLCSNRHRLAHISLNMDDICLVKKAVNGTLNEVILGVLSAGFVRYLSRRYEKGKGETPMNSVASGSRENGHPLLLKSSRVRALCAVNMRRSPVLKDLEGKMKNPSEATWGNKLSFWVFPLPMREYTDPLEYCRVTANVSKMKKLSFEASIIFAMLKYNTTKLMAYVSRRLALRLTLDFSNVMGPPEEVCHGDNPIVHIIPTAQVNHVAVVIHFISYAGKGKLIALVHEEVLPDPEVLCGDCADALQRMTQEAAATCRTLAPAHAC